MQTNVKLINFFLLIGLTFFFSSCLTNVEDPIENDPDLEDPCKTITYSLSVKPIIDNNCTQCHSASGGQFPNLDSYNGLSANANNVLAEVESRRMPLGGSLTSTEIAAIKCWVSNGALNN